jgi:hypothetical protein
MQIELKFSCIVRECRCIPKERLKAQQLSVNFSLSLKRLGYERGELRILYLKVKGNKATVFLSAFTFVGFLFI